MKSRNTKEQNDKKFSSPPIQTGEIYGQRYASPLQGIMADAHQQAIISIINKRKNKTEIPNETASNENHENIDDLIESLLKSIENKNSTEEELLSDTDSSQNM